MSHLSIAQASVRPVTGSPGERLSVGLLLLLATAWYAALLTNGHFDLLRTGSTLDKTFNSMLAHLLQLKFDVDPTIVGKEGFQRDGRVYAYWGPLLSIFRLPLLLLPAGLDIDITPLSSLIAVSVAAAIKLATLRIVFKTSPATPLHRVLYWALVVTILLSGPQIEFLRPSIYQEVCLWAGTFAAIFVCCAVQGILRRESSATLLIIMALAAGLALLTRVSTGITLCTALFLMACAILIENRDNSLIERGRKLTIPLLILLAAIVVTGAVNYMRWGNPTVFADYSLYLMNSEFPDRLVRTKEYGLFNFARIPLGIVYYFFPIWILQDENGKLLLQDLQYQLLDATELPPSTFFLTDPLLLGLCATAIWLTYAQRRANTINIVQTCAVAIGLSIAPILMLTAISMNFRYRIEFYPLIEFGAFIGAALLGRRQLTHNTSTRIRIGVLVAMFTGVIASHAILALYKVSDFGPGIDYMRNGASAYYINAFKARLFKVNTKPSS